MVSYESMCSFHLHACISLDRLRPSVEILPRVLMPVHPSGSAANRNLGRHVRALASIRAHRAQSSET